MGRMITKKKVVSKRYLSGMRQRWLAYTAAISVLIGVVCVLVVTAFFASSFYSARGNRKRLF